MIPFWHMECLIRPKSRLFRLFSFVTVGKISWLAPQPTKLTSGLMWILWMSAKTFSKAPVHKPLIKVIKLNAYGKILSPSNFDHHRKWLLAQIMPTHALEFPKNRLGQTHPGPPGSYSSEFEPKITHFLWWSKLEGLRISVRVKFYNL